MDSNARGRRPGAGNKSRAVRRGPARNALQDLYLILLIHCGDLAEVDAGLATALRTNLNAWAAMYNLMGGNFSYGQPTDSTTTVEASAVEREPETDPMDRRE